MWYRFWAHCGPGHQSSWEEYVYLDEVPSEDYLVEMWHEMLPAWVDNAIGEQDIVEVLPENIRETKLMDCRLHLRSTLRMMEILGEPVNMYELGRKNGRAEMRARTED